MVCILSPPSEALSPSSPVSHYPLSTGVDQSQQLSLERTTVSKGPSGLGEGCGDPKCYLLLLHQEELLPSFATLISRPPLALCASVTPEEPFKSGGLGFDF